MSKRKRDEPTSQELVPKKTEQPADLTPFITLGQQWLEGQSEEARLSHEVEKEELSVLRQANRYSFWLLVVIIAAVFLMAGGLIFYKDQLEAGLLVLSHVGAIVAGLLAGMGLERARRRVDE